MELELRLRRVNSCEVADYNSFEESPSSSCTIQTEGEVLGFAGSEVHQLAISWEHVIQFLTLDNFASIIEDETGRWSERRNAVDHTSRGMLVGITREFAKKRKVLAVS